MFHHVVTCHLGFAYDCGVSHDPGCSRCTWAWFLLSGCLGVASGQNILCDLLSWGGSCPVESFEGGGHILTQLIFCHPPSYHSAWCQAASPQCWLSFCFKFLRPNWPISASRECYNICLFLGKEERLPGTFCPLLNPVEQINTLSHEWRSLRL